MINFPIKFIFLKTPQLRHNFRCHRGNLVFPIIRSEIYQARQSDGKYEFYGKAISGVVSVDDFHTAIKEGYVSLTVES